MPKEGLQTVIGSNESVVPMTIGAPGDLLTLKHRLTKMRKRSSWIGGIRQKNKIRLGGNDRCGGFS